MTTPDETTLPDGATPEPEKRHGQEQVLQALNRIETAVAEIRLELRVVEINVRLALQGLRMVTQDIAIRKELGEIIPEIDLVLKTDG